MGYYTRFSLTVYEGKHEVDSAFIPGFADKKLCGNFYSLQDFIDGGSDSCKWYDHKKEMLEISKLYPDLVFVLDGDGEEAGDCWREFYKNGKTYRWELEVKRPPFDSKKLS